MAENHCKLQICNLQFAICILQFAFCNFLLVPKLLFGNVLPRNSCFVAIPSCKMCHLLQFAPVCCFVPTFAAQCPGKCQNAKTPKCQMPNAPSPSGTC